MRVREVDSVALIRALRRSGSYQPSERLLRAREEVKRLRQSQELEIPGPENPGCASLDLSNTHEGVTDR